LIIIAIGIGLLLRGLLGG